MRALVSFTLQRKLCTNMCRHNFQAIHRSLVVCCLGIFQNVSPKLPILFLASIGKKRLFTRRNGCRKKPCPSITYTTARAARFSAQSGISYTIKASAPALQASADSIGQPRGSTENQGTLTQHLC